ncbi:MAG: hypothetical protein H7Z19_12205, partial [Chitinophagaceae bacterium]|nr:hypothetical protein [Rubrivivax sp.]
RVRREEVVVEDEKRDDFRFDLAATGQFYAGEGATRGGVSARPPLPWLQQVPRAFRDPIPLRANAFSEPPGEVHPLTAPDYARLADWLSAEPAVRRNFPRRFAPLARNPDFRRAVQARMAAHPEWDPVLNPPPAMPK